MKAILGIAETIILVLGSARTAGALQIFPARFTRTARTSGLYPNFERSREVASKKQELPVAHTKSTEVSREVTYSSPTINPFIIHLTINDLQKLINFKVVLPIGIAMGIGNSKVMFSDDFEPQFFIKSNGTLILLPGVQPNSGLLIFFCHINIKMK